MVMVELPEPGAAIGFGANVTVTPAGAPLELSVTALLNPPTTAVVIFDVPELPCATLTVVGEALMEKSGAAVTVSVTVVLCELPPPVPVTVIG